MEYRVEKGFPVWSDGRVHTRLTHNPSSLRFSSVNPNLQNLPRLTSGDLAKWVKECFVAPEGYTFWARDYSGIEAVLVGYFAGSARYIRFAKLGVHAYLASHLVARPADLSWSDADLRGYFKQLKKEEPVAYDTAKRCVHGSNYMMTPKKMYDEYPETFSTIKAAATLQGCYFELFPEIRDWHRDLCDRVDGTKRRRGEEGESVDPWTLGISYVQNPFGYVHRFYSVLDWERIDGKWYSSFGEDAKRLVSFLPQSTAAGIIKRATKRIWAEDREVTGESLRLLIHDEIFGETLIKDVDRCLDVSQRLMEAPIPQLPLDPTWGLGEFLTIGTEPKVGPCWAQMR